MSNTVIAIPLTLLSSFIQASLRMCKPLSASSLQGNRTAFILSTQPLDTRRKEPEPSGGESPPELCLVSQHPASNQGGKEWLVLPLGHPLHWEPSLCSVSMDQIGETATDRPRGK